MTVLQYASAFESFLAQLGDYDESYYLVHFIFGLRPEIMRGVYIQQPDSLPGCKEYGRALGVDSSFDGRSPSAYTKEKDVQSPA